MVHNFGRKCFHYLGPRLCPLHTPVWMLLEAWMKCMQTFSKWIEGKSPKHIFCLDNFRKIAWSIEICICPSFFLIRILDMCTPWEYKTRLRIVSLQNWSHWHLDSGILRLSFEPKVHSLFRFHPWLSPPTLQSVNFVGATLADVRWHLSKKFPGKVERLPTTRAAFEEHVWRANF